MTASKESVLVIFGDALPPQWPRLMSKVQAVVAKEHLRGAIEAVDLTYTSLDPLIEAGSIYEGTALLEELPNLRLPSGTPVSKDFTYHGFELWWMHCQNLFLYFCLPYTQYHKLLAHLAQAERVYVFQPPYRSLFSYFLRAHGVGMVEVRKRSLNPQSLPFGVLVQMLLTLIFLPVVFFNRRKVLVFTGDKFEKGKDHDFRLRYIYEELRARNIPFVEFIRGLERWNNVLSHALHRGRPVVYSEAVSFFARFLSTVTGASARAKHAYGGGVVARDHNPSEQFKVLVATHYLRDIYKDIWAIRLTRAIIRLSGIKAAYVTAANERNFHTVLACKLEGILTVGILHGFASRYYNAYDFMPGFEGGKYLGVDRYGVWSPWWREYYVKNSRVYAPEGIVVSGPMRPLQIREMPDSTRVESVSQRKPIKVLFVPGELSAPQELLPYMRALMEDRDISFHLTFRPYRDGFENWLSRHNPELIKSIDPRKIFRGRRIQEDIAECDVVVGTYSTAALEALLQLRPVLFIHTAKWGDYFGLKDHKSPHAFFAENPMKLVELIKKSPFISTKELKQLQGQFFGDPTKNGSAWVVDQLVEALGRTQGRRA